ncbi:carbamoyl-phosphate synthase large chain [Sulfuricurvum sp.]|mgnify:CR=1 FL=1|uniref:pilus assembly FimT family protein n=1 Tax=Sulfuricurvum sp. TaxID=2025608 RepID=UPI00261E72FB|nr:carbamoyl-phosphate synthase large chain [Sulfuricurvum sp.]MDD4884463.1 carbamoyl-phosphate synthase large chain [Sulfuricurvum sp.]
MKRFAFTMLELVFVIIVIGILAVLAMPNFTTNPLQQAAEQVARDIRYTQHLAMMDDKYDPTDQFWYRENWQMEFKKFNSPLEIYYEIYADTDHLGNSDINETARDPLTGYLLDHDGNVTNLTKNFGIINVIFSANCMQGGGVGEMSFDSMGRPNYYVTSGTTLNQYLLTTDCNITLQHKADGNATITIRPDTGYVSVRYINP